VSGGVWAIIGKSKKELGDENRLLKTEHVQVARDSKPTPSQKVIAWKQKRVDTHKPGKTSSMMGGGKGGR